MIPAGTVNLSINVPKDERSVLGQAAFAAGQSLNGYVKRLIARGLEAESPATAEKLREVRRQYYGVTLLIVFCGALLCGEAQELRRTRTRVEEAREEASV